MVTQRLQATRVEPPGERVLPLRQEAPSPAGGTASIGSTFCDFSTRRIVLIFVPADTEREQRSFRLVVARPFVEDVILIIVDMGNCNLRPRKRKGVFQSVGMRKVMSLQRFFSFRVEPERRRIIGKEQ